MKIDISRSSVPNLFTAVQLDQLRGWLFLLGKLDQAGTCHPSCVVNLNVIHYLRGEVTLNDKQMEVFSFDPKTNHITLDERYFSGKAIDIKATPGGLILTVILDHFQNVSGLNRERFTTTVKGYKRKIANDFAKLMLLTAAVSDKPMYSADGWRIEKAMGHIQLIQPNGLVAITNNCGVLIPGPAVVTMEALDDNLVSVIGELRKQVLSAREIATVHHRMFIKAFTKEWARSKNLFQPNALHNTILENNDCVTITDTGFEYTYTYGNTSGFVSWKSGDKDVIIAQPLLDAFNDPEFGVPAIAEHLALAVTHYVENECTASVSGISNDQLRVLGITPFRLRKHYRDWKNQWNGSQMTFAYYLQHYV